MTLRERVARARSAARWKNEDENDAAIAEVFRFVEETLGKIAGIGGYLDGLTDKGVIDSIRRVAGEKP